MYFFFNSHIALVMDKAYKVTARNFPAATFAKDKKSKTVVCYAHRLARRILPMQLSQTANM